MSFFSFVAKWTGLSKVRQAFAATSAAIGESLAKNNLEEFVLKRIKMRFEPQGANLYAQKGPDGVPWPTIEESTLKRRKYNRNRAQALVDSGALRDSIIILDSNIMQGRSGKARIGIDPASPAAKYAYLHQYGGTNPAGFRIPARPFLEFSVQDEKAAGESVFKTIFRRARMFW